MRTSIASPSQFIVPLNGSLQVAPSQAIPSLQEAIQYCHSDVRGRNWSGRVLSADEVAVRSIYLNSRKWLRPIQGGRETTEKPTALLASRRDTERPRAARRSGAGAAVRCNLGSLCYTRIPVYVQTVMQVRAVHTVQLCDT